MVEVTEAADEGKPVDIIYLDFTNAFDKVPPQRLHTKLKGVGITIRSGYRYTTGWWAENN
jgi:hypothetical protein